ncbi:RDD family protein [Nocardia jejuensis]|uniref:RDD family protein n=1 Tax=Nocardia jejuensis TaxID=328049 RepID=UPI00082AC908|nr:RDD family protein [Nocardia jejuensis]
MSYPNSPYPTQPPPGQPEYDYTKQPNGFGDPQHPETAGYPPQTDASGYPPHADPGGYPQHAEPGGYPQNPYGAGYPQQPGGPGYPQGPQPGFGYPQAAYPGSGGYSPFGVPPSNYAHWGLRIGARLIDMLVVMGPAFLLFVLASTVGSDTVACSRYSARDYSSYDSKSCESDTVLNTAGGIFVLLAVVSYIAIALYLAYVEGTTGQGPGKRVVGIRLIRESTGQPVGFGLAIGRQLLHVVDNLACHLGWFWPIWDDKSQTLADKIAGTVVVRA